jgi:hypothetical protein
MPSYDDGNAFKMQVFPCSSNKTRAQYAALKPLLQ